jgi:hypothetical protein
MQSGDVVEYKGMSREQVTWASSDNPSYLIIGRRYVVRSVQIYPWYTTITLLNKSGQFNSVHFTKVE